MSVVYVLTAPIPEDSENAIVEQIRKRAKWDNDDYVCKGLILNGMSDPLFDIYQNVESSKELWDSLEVKYMVEDASSKKFLGSNVTNYKMTDSRSVMEQYNELLGILGRFTQHKMNMDEAIQVSCIIDKLSPSWKDFKRTLKHQKEELTLVKLGSHLRIEESLRVQDNDKPKGNNVVDPSIVKMMEHNNSFRIAKVKKLATRPMDDDIAWWVDSGATVHVCKDRCYFKTYESLNNGSTLHMENESTALDEALDKFNVFKTEVELQQGSLIKRFRIDKGGEYLDTQYFKSVGIIHEMTAPHTPQQNGISERKNRVLEEMVDSMLSYSGLSQEFWGKAMQPSFTTDWMKPDGLMVLHASPLNETGMLVVDSVDVRGDPDSGIGGHWRSSDSGMYKFILILRALAVFRFRRALAVFRFRHAFTKNGIACIYLEGPPHHDFSLMDILPGKSTSYILDSWYSLVLRPSLIIPNGTEDIGGSVVHEEVTKKVVQQPELELRKSKRNRTSNNFGPEFQLYLIEGTMDEKEAINDDMDSIMGNNTWVLTDLPPSCKPLGCKWIFKRKLKVDGTIEKFKARLVIQGSKQKSGINYFDTYALVQAPKQWHQKFDEVVLSNVYLLNQVDKCVYSKFDETGKGVIICLYVDKILVSGTYQVQVDLTKEFLSSRFSMKDMGEADVILVIKIKHESNGIAISQSHYIANVLKKFNYFDCTSVSTPMDTSEKLMPNNGQAVSQLEYSRVIGCLMYAMTCTRPDISFTVGKLSRYTSNPGTQH
ncbi:zinc finger, CCHC-type containing protein, partial [Tanacetum coccineum]